MCFKRRVEGRAGTAGPKVGGKRAVEKAEQAKREPRGGAQGAAVGLEGAGATGAAAPTGASAASDEQRGGPKASEGQQLGAAEERSRVMPTQKSQGGEASMAMVREMLRSESGRGGEAPSAFRRAASQRRSKILSKRGRLAAARAAGGAVRKKKRCEELSEQLEEGGPGELAEGKWLGLRDGKDLAQDWKPLHEPTDTPGPPSAALKAQDTDKESRKLQVNTAFNQFCSQLPLDSLAPDPANTLNV